MIVLTQHAIERGKERLSLNEKSLQKISDRAFGAGIKHADTKGRLNKYITSLYFKGTGANNIRIYGDNVFFFNNDVLITVYQIPVELRRYAKAVK